MLTLLALLAQVPEPSPSDEMLDFEQDLQGWFDQRYAPAVRARWPEAEPAARLVSVDTRWGPDAISYPRPCGALTQEPAEDGLTLDQIGSARLRLGPGWDALPTGFTSQGVLGSFRRHPGRVGAPAHFNVALTRLPPDISAQKLFDAGLAHGCSLSKSSDAWMWSGDLLVHVTGPCSEANRFAEWTLLVLDALPGWSGAPAPEWIIYGRCGTMGLNTQTPAEIAEERDQ